MQPIETALAEKGFAALDKRGIFGAAGQKTENQMRVMVLVKATEDSEAGIRADQPTREMFAAMGKFNEELVNAGIIVTADGLKPSSAGKRIAFDGVSRKVIDGPFPHPRELVAGFWIWEVKDMAEAVEWAKRCPNPMPGPSELELRPFNTMEDFAGLMSDAQVAEEEELRKRVEGR